MRAITYTETGGTDVLRLVDKPIREPGPDEVRIRMVRAGVNPTDWKMRSGLTAGAGTNEQNVPGQDGAGVIDAVGAHVPPQRAGERVWIWEAARRGDGSAQEYAVVPAGHAIALPDEASFDLGAALGVPFITAHRCLTVTEDGPSQLGPATLAGRTVLVAGGAGAVGNAAIQLARWSDATVITTISSPDKAQLAAAAGADCVINYREQDVVAEVRRIAPHGVHTIVEVAPAANAAIDTQVVANNGSIAVYANDGGTQLSLTVREAMGTNARWQFVLLYTAPDEARRLAVDAITNALTQQAIGVGEPAGLPLHHYPLEDTAAAHDAVERHAVGKVLIDIGD